MTSTGPFHHALWLVQWPLSISFFVEGLLKIGASTDELQARLVASASGPEGLAVVGAVEVVLALALVLPAATRFLPALTPVGAGCLALALAAGTLGVRLPFGTGVPPLDLAMALAAALVAWGRVAAAPIAALELGPETIRCP